MIMISKVDNRFILAIRALKGIFITLSFSYLKYMMPGNYIRIIIQNTVKVKRTPNYLQPQRAVKKFPSPVTQVRGENML
jgi:hypothetical protein